MKIFLAHYALFTADQNCVLAVLDKLNCQLSLCFCERCAFIDLNWTFSQSVFLPWLKNEKEFSFWLWKTNHLMPHQIFLLSILFIFPIFIKVCEQINYQALILCQAPCKVFYMNYLILTLHGDDYWILWKTRKRRSLSFLIITQWIRWIA